MDTLDLEKLATIVESPAVTEARRRRFAELFAEPAPPAVWRVIPEAAAQGLEPNGIAAPNVTVGPWPNSRSDWVDG